MAEKSEPALARILKTLSRHYGAQVLPVRQTPLDAVVFALVAEGAPWYRVRSFFSKARERFVDWNELRVAFGYEVEAILAECKIPDVRRVSRRLRDALGAMVAKNNFLSLDHYLAMKQTEAKKPLAELEAIIGEFAVASMKQYALEWLVFAPYADIIRPLKRLEAVRSKATNRQTGIELFKGLAREDVNACCALLAELGGRLCTERKPACARCPLLRACPGAKRIKEEAKARAKARKSARSGKAGKKASGGKRASSGKKAPAKKTAAVKKSASSKPVKKPATTPKTGAGGKKAPAKTSTKSSASARSKKSARK